MQFTSSNKNEVALTILNQIDDAIERIKQRTKDIKCSNEFLLSDDGMEKLEATCMLLTAIGESLKNLDKVTDGELLPTYPSIPWKEVKGLRDIIVHHYFDIDPEEIWEIVDKELEPLQCAIRYFIKNISVEVKNNIPNKNIQKISLRRRGRRM